jgi:hypothetical protein
MCFDHFAECRKHSQNPIEPLFYADSGCICFALCCRIFGAQLTPELTPWKWSRIKSVTSLTQHIELHWLIRIPVPIEVFWRVIWIDFQLKIRASESCPDKFSTRLVGLVGE